MIAPSGFRNVSTTTRERYERADGDALIERLSRRRWRVFRRGGRISEVSSRADAIRDALEWCTVIDPRVYLSTSGGAWRLIQDGQPLCVDSPDRSRAEYVARLIGLDPATLRVWDGDASAWRHGITSRWRCLTCTHEGSGTPPAHCPACTSERDHAHGPHAFEVAS